ncbi:hypothetical protein A3C17_02000 [Candidatus Uhrbacteria bacterium RIFCSPHIGHO2_02_FULL_53_13]|uniref:Uncharacterized protein n=1 Tax=Candidatus Uhrbacteria bacterium RIFCSPHIGHO2_02_FULL_53_13 TaxID=1802389 RepID=A0A1F7U0V8_9BACT|nr:MAG: hypothetical protein A3C17_02000 [Candidatus Uhrbacteria bacterium RIFCSPHIGHO2_02_FULL_53_13]
MNTPGGRKPTFPILAWLAQAISALTAYFNTEHDSETDDPLGQYLTEDGEDYQLFVFPYQDASMLSVVGNVENVVELGYDPRDGTLHALVAKDGADTATIKATLPKGVQTIVTIRPHLMGLAVVSMEDGANFIEDRQFAAIVQQLIASGFVPAEGFNGRHTVDPKRIKAILVVTAIDMNEPSMEESFAQALTMDGETVRFVHFVYGRAVLVTDSRAIVTRRLSAEMFATIMDTGNIPMEYLLDSKKVGLDTPPITMISNGTRVIVGLADNETNIAVGVKPNGDIEVVKTTDNYGALVSLFADIAESQTGTAIVTKDGATSRVPLAALSGPFRRAAGISLENGNGATA